MGLDARGIVSAVEIGFYAPVLLLTLFLVVRHGLSRNGGWIFLLIFSIIRIVGAAILILVGAEDSHSKSEGTYIAAYVLESVGLSPLLMATLSFLWVCGEDTIIRLPVWTRHAWRFLRIDLFIGLFLGIGGGFDSASSNVITSNTGSTLRKVSVIHFAAVYVVIVGLHLFFWLHRDRTLLHRRTLLVGCTLALPFLCVRVTYSILSSFSPDTFNFATSSTPAHTNSLTKFNVIAGEWQIYLFMSIIMEYCVVVIHATAGILLPLKSEEQEGNKEGAYLQD